MAGKVSHEVAEWLEVNYWEVAGNMHTVIKVWSTKKNTIQIARTSLLGSSSLSASKLTDASKVETVAKEWLSMFVYEDNQLIKPLQITLIDCREGKVYTESKKIHDRLCERWSDLSCHIYHVDSEYHLKIGEKIEFFLDRTLETHTLASSKSGCCVIV